MKFKNKQLKIVLIFLLVILLFVFFNLIYTLKYKRDNEKFSSFNKDSVGYHINENNEINEIEKLQVNKDCYTRPQIYYYIKSDNLNTLNEYNLYETLENKSVVIYSHDSCNNIYMFDLDYEDYNLISFGLTDSDKILKKVDNYLKYTNIKCLNCLKLVEYDGNQEFDILKYKSIKNLVLQ